MQLRLCCDKLQCCVSWVWEGWNKISCVCACGETSLSEVRAVVVGNSHQKLRGSKCWSSKLVNTGPCVAMGLTVLGT